MEIKFRIANASDIKGIVDLCNDCFGDGTDLEEARRI